MAASTASQSDDAPLGKDIKLLNIDAESLRPSQDLDSGQRPGLDRGSEEAGERMELIDAGTDIESSGRGQCDITSIDESRSQMRDTTRGSEDGTQVDSSDISSDAADSGHIQPVSVKYAMEQGYPELNFRFTTLKTWFLIVTVVLWLSIIGTVVALISIQLSSPAALHVRKTGNYYAIRYVPGLLGTVTTIWFRSIAQSYRRIFPYLVMANRPTLERDGVEVAAETNTNLNVEIIDIGDFIQLIKGRHWTAAAVNIFGVGIALVLVAIKSALIQITEDQAGWAITVDPKIGYIIIALYLTLCMTSVAILIQLSRRQTGLKWNPCSLASQLALVNSSNIFQALDGMEFCTKGMAAARTRVWPRKYGYLRIGYWRDTRVAGNANSETLFHGIRFISADEMYAQDDNVRSSMGRHRNERLRFVTLRPHVLGGNFYPEAEAPIALLSEDDAGSSHWHQSLGFYRYPWGGRGFDIVSWSGGYFYLSDIYIATMMLLSFSGLVALGTALATGAILEPVSYADSVLLNLQTMRNIILNTLPSFTLSLGNSLIMMSDTYHRMLQPIRAMDKPASAQQSLLVDYISPSPVSIIAAAISDGHYRIAWGSFLAMICSIGPIIAGGIFTVDPTSKTFRATPSSAHLVLGVLCVYIIAILIARPGAKYTAGRGLWNIIDTLSFCYDSPIREYPEFSAQGKSDEEIHLKSQVAVARRQYQFGYYLGLSGRRRLGFAEAKVEPPSSTATDSRSPEVIDPHTDGGLGDGARQEARVLSSRGVDRVKSRYGFLRFNASWFRRPEVLRSDDIEMVNRNSGAVDAEGGGD